MEISRLCPTLTDINFRGPLGLAVFSVQYSRAWWSNISSIYFVLRFTHTEWHSLKSMLKFFKNLKSLILGFEFSRDELVENEPAFADDDPEMTLQPLDSLTFDITFDEASAGDLELVKEILSSWPRIRRLSFDVDVYYAFFDFF